MIVFIVYMKAFGVHQRLRSFSLFSLPLTFLMEQT